MKNQKAVIIKKVKKQHGGGHHGGSWKVAYADFVTAMMAFFLLLWLLSMVSPEKRVRLAQYFKHFSIYTSTGTSFILDHSDAIFGEAGQNPEKAFSEMYGETNKQTIGEARTEGEEEKKYVAGEKGTSHGKQRGGETLKESSKQFDKNSSGLEESEDLEKMLKKQIVDRLGDVSDQILFDMVEEGIRLQLIDKHGSTMFESGSSRLTPIAKKVFNVIGENINDLPNKITIEGHTDSNKYTGRSRYSNWELSTERASTARKALEANGLDPKRISRVSGFAATDPLIKDDPSDPRNRRISIIISMMDTIDMPVKQREKKKQTASETKQDNQKTPKEHTPEFHSIMNSREKSSTEPVDAHSTAGRGIALNRGEWSPVLDSSSHGPVVEDRWSPIDSSYYSPPANDNVNPFKGENTVAGRNQAENKNMSKPAVNKTESRKSAEEIMKPFMEKIQKQQTSVRSRNNQSTADHDTSVRQQKRYSPVTDELQNPFIENSNNAPVIKKLGNNGHKVVREKNETDDSAEDFTGRKRGTAIDKSRRINSIEIRKKTSRLTEESGSGTEEDRKSKIPEKDSPIPEINDQKISPVIDKNKWSPVIREN